MSYIGNQLERVQATIDNDGVFYENNQTVTENHTVTNGRNSHTVGPIIISAGLTTTIPSGSRLVIL